MLDLRVKVAILPLAFAIAIPAMAGQATPRISQVEATKIALAAVPRGTVKSVEVEREHGQQVYSFDIAVPGVTGVEEVQVSA